MNIGYTGALGEDAAAAWLANRGFVIRARNFKTRFGEIDIVAEGQGFLIFAEVKTRREDAMVSGLESVTPAKQRRILAAAERYLQLHPTELQPRFDVMEMRVQNGRCLLAHYIEDAFGA